jgi:molybdenum cofactor guanylyltransferase
MTKIAGLILAGGAGRRMGGADKAMLIVGGRTLIEICRDRFAPQVDALAVSANGDPDRFRPFDLPVLPDDAGDQGPLAGIVAGLGWAASIGATALATVAVDTPFFPLDMVRRLAEAGEMTGVAMAESDGRLHPTFALWHRSAWPQVLAAYGGGARALQQVADLVGLHRAEFGDAAGTFFNVNSPADLVEAQVRAGRN